MKGQEDKRRADDYKYLFQKGVAESNPDYDQLQETSVAAAVGVSFTNTIPAARRLEERVKSP